MLGQPVTFLVPEVVGVYLHGELAEGVTATDLTLRVTEMLRATTASSASSSSSTAPAPRRSSLPDRATIANMAPEYGATMGFFPVDDETINYLRGTGRREELCKTVENYYKAQGLFGIPDKGELRLHRPARTRPLDHRPGVAGPKRPQDRIDVPALGEKFNALFTAPRRRRRLRACRRPARHACSRPHACAGRVRGRPLLDAAQASTERDQAEMVSNRPTPTGCRPPPPSIRSTPAPPRLDPHRRHHQLHQHHQPERHARRRPGREKGQRQGPHRRPLRQDLARPRLARRHRLPRRHRPADRNSTNSASRPSATAAPPASATPARSTPPSRTPSRRATSSAPPSSPATATSRPASTASIKANFLMSPPLVVAYALAGRVDIDLTTEPLGTDQDGNPVFLKDLWPTPGRDPRAARRRPQARGLRETLRQPRHRQPEVGRRSTARPAPPTRGTRNPPTSSRRRSSTAHSERRHRGHHRRPPARHLRRLRHHRPHLARRCDQDGHRPAGQYLHRERRREGPASTPTARAAATTAS